MVCGASIRPGESPLLAKKPEASAFGFSFNPAITAICFICAAIIWLLIFVLPTHPSLGPIARLFWVTLSVIVTSAVLVFIDSDQMDMYEKTSGKWKLMPMQWLGFVLVAWPVAIPIYFRTRKSVGPANISKAGEYSSLAYSFVFLLVAIIASSRADLLSPDLDFHEHVKVNQQPLNLTSKRPTVLTLRSATVTTAGGQLPQVPFNRH